MTPDDSERHRISPHARREMQRRGIAEEVVEHVLSQPEQEIPVRPGRVVRQSRISMLEGDRAHLVRVFVDIDRDVPEVVTVYRTSKIDKYWRTAT